jgi:ParB family transcriptional regulator, chromosome partitioning protein
MKAKRPITVSGLVDNGQLPEKTDPTQLTQFKGQEDFSKERIYSVEIEKISPNPYQPRKIFNEEKIRELANTIESEGLLQPIALRAVNSGESYQIIAGERRYRAHQLLGKTEIACVIFICDDKHMLLRAIAENLSRENLTDYETFSSIKNAIPFFETKKELSEAIGIGREDLYRFLSFEGLPDFVLDKLEVDPDLLGKTAATEIKSALAKVEEKQKQLALTYLAEAIDLLEAKELDQNKIVRHIQNGLKNDALNVIESLTRREEFIIDGKMIGFFTTSPNGVTIRVGKGILDEASKDQLQSMINSFLEEYIVKKANEGNK